MANFDAKYENWKNKLLDLGKRNKLLNYKETKSSTLKITYPNYSDLYETFVKNENELVFPRDNSDWSSDDEQEETLPMIDDEQEYARDYGGYGSSLRTNRKPKDLQRVLRNLRNKAKVAVEEQGINILYLSFGFLKYTEVDHSKSTYLAPLVLVPVTLTVESITSPYVLKLHEDEIVVNPNIDRKVFSSIKCKKDYKPKKKTAVAFAIALELDMPTMMDLLARAEIAFSPSNKFDLIVAYFVTNKKYDIFEINAVLFKYGQPLLGY